MSLTSSKAKKDIYQVNPVHVDNDENFASTVWLNVFGGSFCVHAHAHIRMRTVQQGSTK